MRTLNPISASWPWSRRTLMTDFIDDAFSDLDLLTEALLTPARTKAIGFTPSCDVRETKDHFMISFDMPGVHREDIRVEVLDGQLRISGERHSGTEGNDSLSTLRMERAYGKFERTFTIPPSIDTGKVEANFENGVLTIALPKAERAKPKTIQVQSGRPGFFGKLLGSREEGAKEEKDVKAS